MRIAQFTPAETLIICEGSQVQLADLLRLTLMDLLLKQTLAIEEIQRQPSPRDPIRSYRYISQGENFQHHGIRPHENIFILPFDAHPQRKILFRNFVKIGYENSGSEKAYRRLIIKNPRLKNFFKTSFVESLFGGASHSPEGSKVRAELQQNIADLEKSIPELMARDRARGIELLKSIGGNIFLLTGLSFELSNEITRMILEESSRPRTTSGCGGGCFTTYTDFSQEFDNSCAVESSGGCTGGCSADGCSGCGGCGGD